MPRGTLYRLHLRCGDTIRRSIKGNYPSGEWTCPVHQTPQFAIAHEMIDMSAAQLYWRPVTHGHNSANIASYGPDQRYRNEDYVCVDVLRNDLDFSTRPLKRLPVPRFSFTLHLFTDHGMVEVARWTYQPKTRPAPGPLSDRTVNQIVRQKLGV